MKFIPKEVIMGWPALILMILAIPIVVLTWKYSNYALYDSIKALTIKETLDQSSINKLSDDLKKLSPIIKRLDDEDRYVVSIINGVK